MGVQVEAADLRSLPLAFGGNRCLSIRLGPASSSPSRNGLDREVCRVGRAVLEHALGAELELEVLLGGEAQGVNPNLELP